MDFWEGEIIAPSLQLSDHQSRQRTEEALYGCQMDSGIGHYVMLKSSGHRYKEHREGWYGGLEGVKWREGAGRGAVGGTEGGGVASAGVPRATSTRVV